MASITKYAGAITQTSGTGYTSFTNLNNILTYNGLAQANITSSETAEVTLTNFGFNLPEGAEPTKVTVTYAHYSFSSNVNSPRITIQSVVDNNKGFAPTTTLTTYSNSYAPTQLTREQVNSNDFGVTFKYTSSGSDDLFIQYIRVTVEYSLSEYELSVKRGSGKYNEEPYEVEATISNLNLTSYNPTLTMTAPTGFKFKNGTGTGSFTKISDTVATWNPSLTKNTASSTCRFVYDTDVTFPDENTNYTGTFTLVESLNGTSKDYTATIYHKPESSGGETGEYTPYITDDALASLEDIVAIVDQEIPNISTTIWDVAFCFPVNGSNTIQLLGEDTPVKYEDDGNWEDGTTYASSDYTAYVCDYENFKFTAPGRYVLLGYEDIDSSTSWSDYDEATPLNKAYFSINPDKEDLTMPSLTILEPTTEELNRLGDGYTYIAQTYLKHTTTDTYPRDWYTNNRIGVFNDTIENNASLEPSDIYENATYWSKALTTVNAYDNLECEFTYNKDNPLYIIFTGDPIETTSYGFDMGTIKYTEPSIIEREVYGGREPNGHYPVPIKALIDEDPSAATITLTGYETSNSVRLYGLPINISRTNIAVRGIQVTGTIESTDRLTLYAKLVLPDGEVGQRSIIIEREAQEFNMGSLGDLWGFHTLPYSGIQDWQIDFSISNLLSNTNSTIQLRDIEVTIWLEEVEKQDISVLIDGEDIAYYGAFIEDVVIPEGLETDTKFITVDGTDMNDAYRQNIREKTITIDFNISECDLKTSTDMLRQITKLFVNEKDQYNRPIPKRVQFSYYPEDYFEYIMTKPFTVRNEISGYNVTAELTIPAGTSYSIDDSVTNTIGYVQGLAAVRPIITIQPSTPNITIKEALSGQTLNIGYSGEWNDKIVEIDCDNRIVLLKTVDDDTEPIDISKYVDHNSDWFRLYGEYAFEGVNCIIRTVSYNERW